MMLLSSMAPLFFLIGIRGMDNIVPYFKLWIVIGLLVVIPFMILKWRIARSVKSNDTFVINVTEVKSNKEYLFTYLFTVLLPLYSLTISDNREFAAMMFAICFVIFVLWHMNLHFANVLFALWGYRVFTVESFESAILLTTRTSISKDMKELKVHRISNSVFIELKNHNYGVQ